MKTLQLKLKSGITIRNYIDCSQNCKFLHIDGEVCLLFCCCLDVFNSSAKRCEACKNAQDKGWLR